MTKCNSTDAIASKQERHSNKRLTTPEFITRAVAVHGYTYDYNQVEYINSKTKVEIVCKSHGVFYQSPNTHLTGQGCPHCHNERRFLTQAQFLEKSKAIHGDNYDYSQAIYTRNSAKVKITCNGCGVMFEQAPQDHMRGNGCVLCHWDRNSLTQDEFIRESKLVHGAYKYNYKNAGYVDKSSVVILGCNDCGEVFNQDAYRHLRGNGCPNCARETSGFNLTSFTDSCDRNGNGKGTLYVIECFLGDEVFIKIGMTSKTVYKRFSKSKIPYRYKEVYSIVGDSKFIFDIEKSLHRLLRKYKYKPKISFAGQTECFTTIKPIEKLLKELSNTEQLQLLA